MFLKKINLKTSVDLYFLILIFILILYGQWILFSASSIMAYHKKLNYFYYSDKQTLWNFLGIFLMFVFIFFPIKLLKKYNKIIFYFSLVLLFLVFIPGIGKSVQDKDSIDFKRWIQLGFFSFQPSEFAKISYLLFLPDFLQKISLSISIRENLKEYFSFFLIFLLLFLQPQYGIMIIFILVFLIFLVLKGFSIIRLLILGIVSLPFLIFLTIFQSYRWERIQVWLNPYAYKFDKGYQLVMSFRAFAEGGLLGTDISKAIAHRYLTYGHTDFIFSLLAESSGILGVFLLLLLYFLIYIRGYQLIKRIKEEYDFLLACGILFFFILQIIVNISVTTGLIPTTGIGLPFVSYGGSSLISYYILMGIFLNLTRNKNEAKESK